MRQPNGANNRVFCREDGKCERVRSSYNIYYTIDCTRIALTFKKLDTARLLRGVFIFFALSLFPRLVDAHFHCFRTSPL